MMTQARGKRRLRGRAADFEFAIDLPRIARNYFYPVGIDLFEEFGFARAGRAEQHGDFQPGICSWNAARVHASRTTPSWRKMKLTSPVAFSSISLMTW